MSQASLLGQVIHHSELTDDFFLFTDFSSLKNQSIWFSKMMFTGLFQSDTQTLRPHHYKSLLKFILCVLLRRKVFSVSYESRNYWNESFPFLCFLGLWSAVEHYHDVMILLYWLTTGITATFIAIVYVYSRIYLKLAASTLMVSRHLPGIHLLLLFMSIREHTSN